jgi:hypothetical protein
VRAMIALAAATQRGLIAANRQCRAGAQAIRAHSGRRRVATRRHVLQRAATCFNPPPCVATQHAAAQPRRGRRESNQTPTALGWAGRLRRAPLGRRRGGGAVQPRRRRRAVRRARACGEGAPAGPRQHGAGRGAHTARSDRILEASPSKHNRAFAPAWFARHHPCQPPANGDAQYDPPVVPTPPARAGVPRARAARVQVDWGDVWRDGIKCCRRATIEAVGVRRWSQ